MNKIIYALPLVALMSCKENKQWSYAPTFKGFRTVSALADQQPLDVLVAGDSIIITAVQATKGDLIFRATYDWRVTFKSFDGTINEPKTQTKKVVYDNDRSDPQLRLRLWDKPGTLSVSFDALYEYSSINVDLNLPATTGPIATSSSTLLGNAKGSIVYTVE